MNTTNPATANPLGDKAEFLKELTDWLDSPQMHLDDETRRRLLESLVSEYVDRVRRKERARTRGRDLVLFLAILTSAGSILPQLYNYIWVVQ